MPVSPTSQRSLTMLVGVVALHYQHQTTLGGFENGVPQLLET